MNHQQAVQNLAVESYLLGEMLPQDREAFEEHFFECPVCGEDVRAAAQFMEEARKVLGESGRLVPVSSLPAKVPGGGRTPGWLVWLKPQFAAPALAALLLVVGYQSFRTIPNLRQQVEESGALQVVTHSTLRRAVRGDSTVIKTSPGTAMLLTLDFPDGPAKGTALQFIIESGEGNDGKEVARLYGAAPEPRGTVDLIIRNLELPPGPYIVVAEIAAQSRTHGQEVGRYPFRLELQEGAERSK